MNDSKTLVFITLLIVAVCVVFFFGLMTSNHFIPIFLLLSLDFVACVAGMRDESRRF